jgi:hypothetical protein
MTKKAKIIVLDANILIRAVLALVFGCPIWTEDQDFFGTGIATWRTKNIEIFFQ